MILNFYKHAMSLVQLYSATIKVLSRQNIFSLFTQIEIFNNLLRDKVVWGLEVDHSMLPDLIGLQSIISHHRISGG